MRLYRNLAAFFLAVFAGSDLTYAQTADEIRRMLEERGRALDLGAGRAPREETSPTGVRGWVQYYEDAGSLYYVPRRGIFLVTHAMDLAGRGGDPHAVRRHTLGFPVSHQLRCSTPDNRDRYQLFEQGAMFFRSAENRYVVAQGFVPATPGDCAVRAGAPVATVVTAPAGAPAVRHRYRVTILGFAAVRPTFDGHQELDGKGDEVYVVAQVARFAPNGALMSNTCERSVLMGDTNMRPSGEERLRAGDLSPQGGIGAGTIVRPAQNPSVRYSRPTLPWVVFEGDLVAGVDAVMIIPSVWEWDGIAHNYDSYRNYYFGVGRANQPFFYPSADEWYRRDLDPSVRSVGRGWVTGLVSASLASPSGLAPTSVWGAGPVISSPLDPIGMNDGDAPIGISHATNERRGGFEPQIIFLTENLARRVATTTYAHGAIPSPRGNVGVVAYPPLGPGVVSVNYRGTDEGRGHYVIYVKIEQLR